MHPPREEENGKSKVSALSTRGTMHLNSVLCSGLIGGTASKYAYFSMIPSFLRFLQESSEAAALNKAEELAAALSEKADEVAQLQQTVENNDAFAKQQLVVFS